ncbi:lantibiotic dehydratase family protein [Chryseobacterium hispalense]|uniref:lantibiotic dehydratase family protein n=2 Tax=Chryseobacterium TaxID=59732 RepID=UPI00049363B5|nr:lantibiotic dehydratase family protein [Chryseobacterium hispalense]
MKNKKFIPFKNYLLRTPVFSLNFYNDLTAESIISNSTFIQLIDNSIVREAVFLASPSFLHELDDWRKNQNKESEKVEKLKYTLLKYVSRMSSRCTPYGIFAACTIGNFQAETSVQLNDASQFDRHTRLDMYYMVSLYYELTKTDEIRNKLKFYPNSTLFKFFEKYRYVEYYYKNNKRHYEVVAVDFSEYLSELISAASKGATVADLILVLTELGFDKDESADFIDEVILNQILVSELEPNVSGAEFQNEIVRILEKYNVPAVNVLKEIFQNLLILDESLGNDINNYIDISEKARQLNVPFDLKHLFQCDLISDALSNTLDKKIADQIIPALKLVNKISISGTKTHLDKFKDSFYERYEEMEIPLALALDPEAGIGYASNQMGNDFNPLIDDLPFNAKNLSKNTDLKFTEVDNILHRKILNSIKNKEFKISVNDDDFKNITNSNGDNLPPTISVLIEIIKEQDAEKIVFGGWGGSSGANLIARFCHSDNKINEHVVDIIAAEHAENDAIVAEIVHLPESRVGNILSRPDFRDFEISYLAKSVKPKEKQIYIDDLFISIRNGRLHLRSASLNKEVIPKLTTAHNFSNSKSLPIYHFLCDMQFNKNMRGAGIPLNNLESLYNFIPRIEYKNLILSPAYWILNYDDISHLLKLDDLQLQNEIEVLKNKLSLPQYVLLADGDNELLINLKNLTSVKMFLSTVKNRNKFKLSEFLFSFENSVVTDANNNKYTNEFIISFKVE